MVLEEGNRLVDGNIARGCVVQVVQEDGDLGVLEIRQQINDPVDRGTRPLMAFGRHCGGVDAGRGSGKRMNWIDGRILAQGARDLRRRGVVW